MTVQETIYTQLDKDEIEVRSPVDQRAYTDFEEFVRSVRNPRILAALLFDFYRRYKNLHARMVQHEALMQRIAGQGVSDVDPEILEATIEESRTILQLEDDFDGMGSPHYSETTWQRAVLFVRLQWEEYVRLFCEPMPIPAIQPGPHGSIDVFWETLDFDLLVNIPPALNQEAEFSGDRNGKRRFDGTLNPALPNRGLVSWLAR
jgi:hypothetical protein